MAGMVPVNIQVATVGGWLCLDISKHYDLSVADVVFFFCGISFIGP